MPATALVPPTVVDDPALPHETIRVAGEERTIHLRRFGDPDAPVLMITHGSVSDIRAYLPLQELSDAWHVVLWDMRGNGLSERVPAEELDPEDMVAEIEAVRQRVAGERQVAVMGHSWSAVFMAMYLAEHGDKVHQAVLIEPNGFSADIQREVGLALSLFDAGYLDMAWGQEGLSPRDHATLDYYALQMIHSDIRVFHCADASPPAWPVWRPGGLAVAHWEAAILDGATLDFDYTAGMDDHEGPVLFVGTECSPIGSDFQQGNMAEFPHAELLHIDNAGHRLLTEQYDTFVQGLRDWLDPDGLRDAEGGR